MLSVGRNNSEASNSSQEFPNTSLAHRARKCSGSAVSTPAAATWSVELGGGRAGTPSKVGRCIERDPWSGGDFVRLLPQWRTSWCLRNEDRRENLAAEY